MTAILQLATYGEFCVHTLRHIFLLMRVSFKIFDEILHSSLYRVIGEEMPIFWEMRVSVIMRKDFIWTHLSFSMLTEMELFEFPDPTLLDFCLWGWMKSQVCYKFACTAVRIYALRTDERSSFAGRNRTCSISHYTHTASENKLVFYRDVSSGYFAG
jgi:hypothetical protein